MLSHYHWHPWRKRRLRNTLEIIAGVLEWNYSHLRLESSSCLFNYRSSNNFFAIQSEICFSLSREIRVVQNFPASNDYGWGVSFRSRINPKRSDWTFHWILLCRLNQKRRFDLFFMLAFPRNRIEKGTEKGKLEFYSCWCVPQDLLHLRQTYGSLSIDECRQTEGQIFKMSDSSIEPMGDDLLNSFSTVLFPLASRAIQLIS